MFSVVATLLVFVITFVLVLDWQKHKYWSSRGVPTPIYFPLVGHTPLLFIGFSWEWMAKVSWQFKSSGIWGIYNGFTPSCVITDPTFIRDVMVKEADHFIDRREFKFNGVKGEIFNEMLSLLTGEKWKALRSLMSPTFSSGKIKNMFPLVEQKVDIFLKECEAEMEMNSFVEINSLFSYFTMDVVGCCAFGIDTSCLCDREHSPFINRGKALVSFDSLKAYKFILQNVCPRLHTALGFDEDEKNECNFFSNLVKETVNNRSSSGIKRGDFLDLMLEILEESEHNRDTFKYPMTMNTVIAQAVLFLLAGFDPTANTMTFMAYLLAKNPHVQNALREELTTLVDADGNISYRSLVDASYLEACLSETLRLIPTAHVAERKCTRNFTLPGTKIEIPEGMIVQIPVWGVHRDPTYWEDPLTFKPERFLPQNKGDLIPYCYLPFGLGPRNCIAMRFAQMEVKLVLAKLCLNFELKLRPGFDLKLEKTLSTLRPDRNGVQLVLQKIPVSPAKAQSG